MLFFCFFVFSGGLDVDFASRVLPRQHEAQILVKSLIFDDFQNFRYWLTKLVLCNLGVHWTLGDSGLFIFWEL